MHRKLRKNLIEKDELFRLQQKIEAVKLFKPNQIRVMLNDLSRSTKASMDTFFEVPATLLANLDAWVIKYGVSKKDFIKILSHARGLLHLEAFFKHYEVLSQYFLTSELLIIANKTFAHHRFEILTQTYASLLSKGYDKTQIYQMITQSGGARILALVDKKHDRLKTLGYQPADVVRMVLFKQGHINLAILLRYHRALYDLGYSLQQITTLAACANLSQSICVARFEYVRVNTERFLSANFTRDRLISLAISPTFSEETDLHKSNPCSALGNGVNKRNRAFAFFSPSQRRRRAELSERITTERHEAMWTDILDHAENEETVAIVLPEDDKLPPFLGMD